MPHPVTLTSGDGSVDAPLDRVWRTRDADLLTEQWDQAIAGRARTVVLRGDAGAGKSRLVAALADRVRATGGVVVTGAAVDVGEQPPCSPVAAGLRRLLDGPSRASAPPVRRVLDTAADDLSALLDPSVRPGEPAGALLERVRRTVAGLAAAAPTLLVVDDLQWADRATRELVVYLVAHLSAEPVLLIATVRDEGLADDHPLRRLLPELARDARVVSHTLRPLDRDAVAEIVGATGSTGPPAPTGAELVDLVWDRSGGNAFIVGETLRAVRDGEIDAVSATLRELVLSRVAALGADARLLASMLSLGEEPVPHPLLAAATGLDEEALLAAVREASRASVVVADTAADGYALRHGLMRDVLAAELLPGERRRLHRRYAHALDALEAGTTVLVRDDPAMTALRRAHHWSAADDAERALPALVDAARAAESRRWFGTAHRQWMAALDLAERRAGRRVDQRALPPAARRRAIGPHNGAEPMTIDVTPDAGHDPTVLLSRAADTAHLAGEHEAAVGLLRRVVPDPAAADPGDLPSVVRLAQFMLDAGRTSDALEVLEAAVGAGRHTERDGSADRAALHAVHAEALLVTRDVPAARKAAEQALTLSRIGGRRPEQAPMLATLGFALAYLENAEAGIAALADGLRIAEETGGPAQIGRAYQAWADLLAGPLGEIDEGVALAYQGLARMRELGLTRTAGVQLLSTAAGGLFRLGRWREAQDAVDEAWALRPTGADALEVRLARCRLLVGRGEFDLAEEDVRAIDLLALDGGASGSPVAARYRVPLLTLRAGLQMWRGHPEAARLLVARGLTMVERTPDDLFLVAPLVWHGLRAEAEAASRGDHPNREALARLGTAAARVETRMPGVPPALRRTVSAYVRMCRAEAARAARTDDPGLWARVAQDWGALLNPYNVAYAQLRRADALIAAGARSGEPARCLASAHETARAMGAAPFLAEIEAVARRGRIDLGGGEAARAGRPGADEARPEVSGAAARSAPELCGLTAREHEVLAELAEGLSNREVARKLDIRERTVAVHVSHILAKTETRSRTQAAALLRRVTARAEHQHTPGGTP